VVSVSNGQIVFACISPHPPILLPSVGSPQDRAQVKNTIQALEGLGKKLKELKPRLIIISSPHPDWGFDVPLYFLAKDFEGKIETYLLGLESPQFCFKKGKEVYQSKVKGQESKVAVIASGDMSHCLKEEGPYGFNPDGPKFDKAFIEFLKNKDVENIFKLDELYSEAGECGLRSFCFLLGILEASGLSWQPEILSYEGPFGVGYLVANFKVTVH
jgi:aromatic ring-opening dioxygenase LigB subunit